RPPRRRGGARDERAGGGAAERGRACGARPPGLSRVTGAAPKPTTPAAELAAGALAWSSDAGAMSLADRRRAGAARAGGAGEDAGREQRRVARGARRDRTLDRQRVAALPRAP